MIANTGVFVLKDESTLVAMQQASFASENDFQRLLASFPELLAGDQIDQEAPRRFLLVSREQGIASEEGGGGRWSIDHLFLDQDGIPTLVEVKRGTDTRIRREVVGQMLDYAANSVVYWPIEQLRSEFERRCEAEGKDPATLVSELIGPDLQIDSWWTQVKTNLQAGKIRMLFVADRIPAELKRVVEFLNVQMQPAEVLAVELRQYEGQGLKTLVPIVHGQTQEAVQKKGSSGAREQRVWDEASILSELATRCPAQALEAAKSIALWIQDRADDVQFNTNARWGSMGPVFRVAVDQIYPFLIHTDGTIAVYFQYMIGKPVFGDLAKRQELLDRLNAIAGINLPPDAVSKRKGIQLSVFTPQTTREFLSVMDWFVEQLRAELRNSQNSA